MYRSLLRESTRVGTATGSVTISETLQALIRYRFQKDRNILSPTQVANGISAGYGFLDLLRSCSNKAASALDRLSQTLESVRIHAEETAAARTRFASLWKPPPAHRMKHIENLHRVRNKANHLSTPSNPRIFQHPRPISEVKSGIRKVPNLILTQGIPVLKYPGPQPVLLNRVLKTKVKWSIKKMQQHSSLEEQIQLAESEDQWEDILARDHGETVCRDRDSDRTQAPSETYAATTRQADFELWRAFIARGKKHTQLGQKLWKVVLAERELKEKERREAKHARRMARKKATGELARGQEDPLNETSSVASGFI